MARKRQIAFIHPGQILLLDFLKPMGISQYRLAKDIGVPARRINEIVKGLRGITPDTAIRFGIYFDMSAEFWVNLQTHFDLAKARASLGPRLAKEISSRAA